jgi:hypothetical protein
LSCESTCLEAEELSADLSFYEFRVLLHSDFLLCVLCDRRATAGIVDGRVPAARIAGEVPAMADCQWTAHPLERLFQEMNSQLRTDLICARESA